MQEAVPYVFATILGIVGKWVINLFREYIKNDAIKTAAQALYWKFEKEEELLSAIVDWVISKLERWNIKISKSELMIMAQQAIQEIKESQKEKPMEEEPPLMLEPAKEEEPEPHLTGFNWANIKYFKESEFNCPSCHNTGTEGMNPNLVKLLDAMREHFGQPITITSGYRCATYNKKVGGISGSQHTKGNAADFFIKGQSETYKGRVEAIKWAIDYAKKNGLKFRYGYTVDTNGVGLGFYDDGIGKKTTSTTMGRAIHIDCYR